MLGLVVTVTRHVTIIIETDRHYTVYRAIQADKEKTILKHFWKIQRAGYF